MTRRVGTCAARAWCMLLVALSPTEIVATVLAVVTKILFVIQAGYLVTDTEDVKGWYWMMVISYPRYMFRAACKVTIGPLYDVTTGLTGSQYLELFYSFNDSLYSRWMVSRRAVQNLALQQQTQQCC